MKLGTGNQLLGIIDKLDMGRSCAIVTIDIHGFKIKAAISRKAFDKLHIKEGLPAIAIISEFDIMLASDEINIGSVNKISGPIIKIDKDDINCNVYLKISDEDELCTSISRASFDNLHMNEGENALAVFDMYSVVVAC